ncbi:MAG: hypothetical protein SNJ71_03140, partial [Bacteroidales bacterium]
VIHRTSAFAAAAEDASIDRLFDERPQMLMWIYVNSFVPVLIIITLGLMVLFLRNIKYRRIKFNNGNIKK